MPKCSRINNSTSPYQTSKNSLYITAKNLLMILTNDTFFINIFFECVFLTDTPTRIHTKKKNTCSKIDCQK